MLFEQRVDRRLLRVAGPKHFGPVLSQADHRGLSPTLSLETRLPGFTTVRESLRLLEHRGRIKLVPRRGDRCP